MNLILDTGHSNSTGGYDDEKLSSKAEVACIKHSEAQSVTADCFAADTQIQIMDRLSRQASQVHAGDRLMGFSNKMLCVQNTFTNTVDSIIRITTVDNGSIRVTGDHIMKVFDPTLPEDNDVPAKGMKARNMLMRLWTDSIEGCILRRRNTDDASTRL